jgi:hypothetical protein
MTTGGGVVVQISVDVGGMRTMGPSSGQKVIVPSLWDVRVTGGCEGRGGCHQTAQYSSSQSEPPLAKAPQSERQGTVRRRQWSHLYTDRRSELSSVSVWVVDFKQKEQAPRSFLADMGQSGNESRWVHFGAGR